MYAAWYFCYGELSSGGSGASVLNGILASTGGGYIRVDEMLYIYKIVFGQQLWEHVAGI